MRKSHTAAGALQAYEAEHARQYHRAEARRLKAAKIAAHVVRQADHLGVDLLSEVDRLAGADQQERDILAQQAGVNSPSAETWTLALHAMALVAAGRAAGADLDTLASDLEAIA